MVEENGRQLVSDVTNGTMVGYKYFAFDGPVELTVTVRGEASGVLRVSTSEGGAPLAELAVAPWEEWRTLSARLNVPQAAAPLFLKFVGQGKLQLLELSFGGDRQ